MNAYLPAGLRVAAALVLKDDEVIRRNTDGLRRLDAVEVGTLHSKMIDL